MPVRNGRDGFFDLLETLQEVLTEENRNAPEQV